MLQGVLSYESTSKRFLDSQEWKIKQFFHVKGFDGFFGNKLKFKIKLDFTSWSGIFTALKKLFWYFESIQVELNRNSKTELYFLLETPKTYGYVFKGFFFPVVLIFCLLILFLEQNFHMQIKKTSRVQCSLLCFILKNCLI